MKAKMCAGLLAIGLILAARAALAAPVDGAAVFLQSCAQCHAAPESGRAPRVESLRLLQPNFVVDTLTSGVMRLQGMRLNPAEMRAVAEYVTAKPFTTEALDLSAGLCALQKPMADVSAQPRWTGWGVDLSNRRFQPRAMARMAAADVPKLKLKWAFGFPDTSHAWSQPTVAGGRVFVGSQGGRVFALDAKTGCIRWSFLATGPTRTAIVVGGWPGRPESYLAYFTTIPGWLYALDAETGKQVWKVRVEDHLSTRMTGSPVLYKDRLYVPSASFEEGMSASGDYDCCTFRGSLSAFEALTGKRIWKTAMIGGPLSVLKTNDGGRRLLGPSGGSSWSSPVIDPARRAIYLTTGNGFSGPPQPLTDAIVALDLDTGQVRWSRQVGQDIFVPGCGRPGNANFSCPDENGPDADFGSAPILVHLAKGRDLVLAGQKSGTLWAVDPDQQGRVVWRYRAAPSAAGDFGALVWGQAADDRNAYVPVSNIQDPAHAGGLHAVALATGQRAWYARPPPPGCTPGPGCTVAQAAAPSVIDGVVFAGSADGALRAYDTSDGKVLWSADTGGDFATTNGVKAHGGSMIGPGPAIADGMLYVNSGYGSHGGRGGNVLLAYGLE
ncbi:MAG TPA: PQQ-binding-like beta-propeller repeat protein [Rhizomicrobium sp.]|nr:PQQ-binding-like beta-propeller repeat protein [Rhizomicrobium sp.]